LQKIADAISTNKMEELLRTNSDISARYAQTDIDTISYLLGVFRTLALCCDSCKVIGLELKIPRAGL
jgi:hypothetical protein